MRMDRDLQRSLLEAAASDYPRGVLPPDVQNFDEEDHLAAQLAYLDGHGLIESGMQIGVDGHISFGPYSITERGLDFLADDGGLTLLDDLVPANQMAERAAHRVVGVKQVRRDDVGAHQIETVEALAIDSDDANE